MNDSRRGASPGRLAAIVLALALAFVLTCLVRQEPWRAFHALLTGALPQVRWSAELGFTVRRVTRFGSVLEDAVTLSLLGLAVLMGFRARQFSLGADGQFFLGALAAAFVSVNAGVPGWAALWLAGLAAVLTGFAWGWLPGLLKARFAANEIVTTLMLNVVAIQLYRLAITRWFHDPGAGFLATPSVPSGAALASLLDGTNVTAFVFMVPGATALAWLLLERTTRGYEIRLVGDSPAFAEQSGVPVKRAIALSMAFGGAFAGLAGLHVSNALLKRLPVDLSPGLGFEGLVVALLARNDPRAVPLTALTYAYLKGGAQAMESASDVPREMVMILQACIVLFAVSERLVPRGLASVAGAWRARAGAVRSGENPA